MYRAHYSYQKPEDIKSMSMNHIDVWVEAETIEALVEKCLLDKDKYLEYPNLYTRSEEDYNKFITLLKAGGAVTSEFSKILYRLAAKEQDYKE